jgi:hypothetical protein
MSEIEINNVNWVKTPLSKFGFKCIMSKHNSCEDSSCECLCHPVNFSKIELLE